MTRQYPIVALVVACFPCLVLAQCPGSGVQSNTPAATLTVNGRAGDGFGGKPPQDVIRTSSITFTITGAPWVPVILGVGTPIAGGQSLAPHGCLNVNPVFLVLDGFSASGLGAYTTASGSLTLTTGVPPFVSIGTEFTVQAFVANSTTGGSLTAPQRIRVSYATVAYRADQDQDGITELYGATATGSEVVKLSVPQGIFATPGVEPGYAWSPDGTKIAYTATLLFETNLFVSDADGQNPIQISPSGDVIEFQWAPDGSRIAYVSDQDVTGTFELFTALPNGTGIVEISPGIVAGGTVSGVQWSPNAAWVAFRAEDDNAGEFELFRNLPAGGGLLNLSPGIVIPESVTSFKWAPDGSRVAYRADQDVDDVFELYTSTPAGTNVQVSGVLVSGGDVAAFFEWAPDSSRVAYLADQNIDGQNELYTSLPGGGGNVKVSGALVVGGDVMADFAWRPTSANLAYRADAFTDGQIRLFQTQPALASAAELSTSIGATEDVIDFAWQPDGTRCVYRADRVTDDVFELFTVFVSGPALVTAQVSPSLIAGGAVADDFAWSPDSSRIGMRADAAIAGMLDLASNVAGGTTSTAALLTAFVDVVSFRWSPDSARLGFVGDAGVQDDVFELYAIDPATVNGALKISSQLVTGGDVLDFAWSPAP